MRAKKRNMAEAEVNVVSTQLLHARSCKEQRIELAPNDLTSLLMPPISRGLVFLKPQQNGSTIITTNTHVEHLKKSLSTTLDSFFPLAGRLGMVEEHDSGSSGHEKKLVSFFIDCSNQGAQFVHAVANHVTVADILDPVFVPPILHSLFPLKETRNCDGVSQPLLAVQVTELVDGVFIGCHMNHSVADGSSFWNFINSWSEISRQGQHQDPTPVFDRPLFGFPTIRFPFSFKDNELAPPQPAVGGGLESRVFHFSKTKIAELKARTNLCGGGAKISSLQSLLAHVWRFMLQNGGAEPEDETRMVFGIGTRSRFEVPLGDGYFGNAVDSEVVTSTVKEIVDDGVGYAAALQINRAVAGHTPEKVRRNMESWIQNPTILGRGGEFLPSNTFIVVSSPRFNIYGNDFGWGNPVAVRSKPITADGILILFPGAEEGSVDIQICSSSLSLEILRNDPHFT